MADDSAQEIKARNAKAKIKRKNSFEEEYGSEISDDIAELPVVVGEDENGLQRKVTMSLSKDEQEIVKNELKKEGTKKGEAVPIFKVIRMLSLHDPEFKNKLRG